jgi:hypothetical protein
MSVQQSTSLVDACGIGRRRVTATLVLGAAASWVNEVLAAADPPATASDRRTTMSTSNGFPRRYEAIYHGDTTVEQAGVLSMEADGKLKIVQAGDRFAEMLDTIVRNMNAMPHETIRVPPKADEPRYTLRSRVIPRDSGEFIPAMLANIRRGYRLELRATDAP